MIAHIVAPFLTSSVLSPKGNHGEKAYKRKYTLSMIEKNLINSKIISAIIILLRLY